MEFGELIQTKMVVQCLRTTLLLNLLQQYFQDYIMKKNIVSTFLL
jgi:hypothetical protein